MRIRAGCLDECSAHLDVFQKKMHPAGKQRLRHAAAQRAGSFLTGLYHFQKLSEAFCLDKDEQPTANKIDRHSSGLSRFHDLRHPRILYEMLRAVGMSRSSECKKCVYIGELDIYYQFARDRKPMDNVAHVKKTGVWCLWSSRGRR